MSGADIERLSAGCAPELVCGLFVLRSLFHHIVGAAVGAARSIRPAQLSSADWAALRSVAAMLAKNSGSGIRVSRAPFPIGCGSIGPVGTNSIRLLRSVCYYTHCCSLGGFSPGDWLGLVGPLGAGNMGRPPLIRVGVSRYGLGRPGPRPMPWMWSLSRLTR